MIGKMNATGEHLISKELRYMRICFVILIIILIFFDRGKVVEVSTNHDSSPVDTLTSNLQKMHLLIRRMILQVVIDIPLKYLIIILKQLK